MRAGDKMGMVSWLGVSWSWGGGVVFTYGSVTWEKFNLLKEHESKFNVTAINSKHRSYRLARFLARTFLLSTLRGWGITFTVNM